MERVRKRERKWRRKEEKEKERGERWKNESYFFVASCQLQNLKNNHLMRIKFHHKPLVYVTTLYCRTEKVDQKKLATLEVDILVFVGQA